MSRTAVVKCDNKSIMYGGEHAAEQLSMEINSFIEHNGVVDLRIVAHSDFGAFSSPWALIEYTCDRPEAKA